MDVGVGVRMYFCLRITKGCNGDKKCYVNEKKSHYKI